MDVNRDIKYPLLVIYNMLYTSFLFAYQNHYVNVIEMVILMIILVFVYLFCRYLFRESSCPLFNFGTDALHAQIFGITYRKHLDLIIL